MNRLKYVFLTLLLVSACRQADFLDILTSRSLERFVFTHADNPELGFDIAAAPGAEYLAVLPKSTDFSKLVPSYTVDGYALFLDGKRIESGTSSAGVGKQDSESEAVTLAYTIYSYDGNSETKRVRLERPRAWFSQFSFLAADNEVMAAAGIGDLVVSIDEREKQSGGDTTAANIKGSSIWFYLPHNVPVKTLVPSFVKEGNNPEIAAGATVSLMKGDSGDRKDPITPDLLSGEAAIDFSEGCRIRVSVEFDGTTSETDYRVSPFRLTSLSIPGTENNLGDAIYAPEINGDEITVKVPESADLPSLVTDFDFVGYSLEVQGRSFSSKARTNIDYRAPVEFVVSTGTGLSHTYTVTVLSQAIINSVAYNANGGMGDAPADTSTYRYKKSFTVQDQGALAKSGYAFAGWNTRADGTGTEYQPGDSAVMGTQNVVLYAQWTVIQAASVSLSSSSIVLNIAAPSIQLAAAPVPANAIDTTIVWSSSNPGVASVDQSGLVTGAKGIDGTATITATAANGAVASCAVTVDTIAPGKLVMSPSSIGSDAITLNWSDPPDSDLDHIDARLTSISAERNMAVSPGLETLKYQSLPVNTVYSIILKSVDIHGNATAGDTMKVVTPSSGGEKSYDKISIVTDAGGLADILSDTENNVPAYYYLDDDIDDIGDWTSVGDSTKPFIGTFDGGGHTISGLVMTGDNNGMFGSIGTGGTVANLILKDATVSTTGSIAGLLAGENSGTISGCYTSGPVDMSIASGNRTGGGVVGVNQTGGVIANCGSGADVVNGCFGDGGFVGHNEGIITCCYATGKVAASDSLTSNYVGGFVGNNQGDGIISNCFSTGAVSGNAAEKAAFAGISQNNAKFVNCYSSGTVDSGRDGFLQRVIISTANITNCLALITNANNNNVAKFISTAQMKDAATFTNTSLGYVTAAWDFTGTQNNDAASDDIWSIDPSGVINGGLPYLAKNPPR